MRRENDSAHRTTVLTMIITSVKQVRPLRSPLSLPFASQYNIYSIIQVREEAHPSRRRLVASNILPLF